LKKDCSPTREFVSKRSFLAVFMLSDESKKFEKSLDSRPPRRDVVPTPPARALVFYEKEKSHGCI
jgi:hypothetical protein